jgi:hypothetical protein
LPKAYFQRFGKEKLKDVIFCWMKEYKGSNNKIIIEQSTGITKSLLGTIEYPETKRCQIIEGEIMFKEEFDECMELLNKCGYRLMRIKQHLCSQIPEDWSGRERSKI